MEFTLTVVNQEGDSSDFEYTLPTPLEFSDDEEWYVGVVDFVHNDIYGSKKSLIKDLITLPKEWKDNVLTLNEFALLILQRAFNPLLYETDYAEEVIAPSKDIINLIKQNYKEDPKVKNIIKVESAAVLPDDDKETFENIPKPEQYQFIAGKTFTLIDIFYSLLGQTSKHMESLKSLSQDTIRRHLSNFLTFIVRGFRRERKEFLTKFYNKLPNSLILIKTDFISPSICGNQYDQILFTTANRYTYNNELKAANISANYVKVQKKFINKIRFRFCDVDDSPIVFRNNVYNYIYMKLHFINKKILK